MTEIVKFVSNDEDELLEHINSHATTNYENIQQVVYIEKTAVCYDVTTYTAIVVFKRRPL